MTVLVTGGRNFKGMQHLCNVLDVLKPTKIIHGGAKGADSLAGAYAEQYGIPCEVYHAEWDKYGPRAGPIRNQKMLDEGKPDVVVAMVGGDGTADCVSRAKKSGKFVVRHIVDALEFVDDLPW